MKNNPISIVSAIIAFLCILILTGSAVAGTTWQAVGQTTTSQTSHAGIDYGVDKSTTTSGASFRAVNSGLAYSIIPALIIIVLTTINGQIYGYVKDKANNNPIAGATIYKNGVASAVSVNNGLYMISIPPGINVTVKAGKIGYLTSLPVTKSVTSGGKVRLDFNL